MHGEVGDGFCGGERDGEELVVEGELVLATPKLILLVRNSTASLSDATVYASCTLNIMGIEGESLSENWKESSLMKAPEVRHRNGIKEASSKAVRIEELLKKAMGCAMEWCGLIGVDNGRRMKIQAENASWLHRLLGLEEFKQPEVNEYSSRDSSLKPTTVCDREVDNSKESSLKVDKDWKEKFFYPANHIDEEEVEPIPKVEKKTAIPTATKKESVKPEKPIRRSIRSVNTARPFKQFQSNDKGFVDSGCSRHMSGNIARLSDFKEFNGGYVTFGGGANRGKITGKCLQNNSTAGSTNYKKYQFQEVNTGSREVSTAVPEINTATPGKFDRTFPTSEDTQVEDQEIELGNISPSYASSVQTRRMTTSYSELGFLGAYMRKDSPGPTYEAMQEELLQFKLQNVWVLVDLPKGHRAIGTKSNRERRWIFISQDKYVHEILRKFNYTDVKSLPPSTDLCKDFRFPQNFPSLAIKRIFRYLKGKPSLGLWYSKDSPLELVAYTVGGNMLELYLIGFLDSKAKFGESTFQRRRPRGFSVSISVDTKVGRSLIRVRLHVAVIATVKKISSTTIDKASINHQKSDTDEELREFTSEYYIPFALHPVVPAASASIADFPEGKVGVYTRFFEFANQRVPLSLFMCNVLNHYRLHISQLHCIGAAKISNFEVNCRLLAINPTVHLFRAFYHTSWSNGWVSFSKRVGRLQCYTEKLDVLRRWREMFFWVDDALVPWDFAFYTQGSLPRDERPPPGSYSMEDAELINENRIPINAYSEAFLCHMGISRNYFRSPEEVPTFIGDDGQEMDLFSVVHLSKPKLVTEGVRPLRDGEEPLLESTAGRTMELVLEQPEVESTDVLAPIPLRSVPGAESEAGEVDSGLKRKRATSDDGAGTSKRVRYVSLGGSTSTEEETPDAPPMLAAKEVTETPPLNVEATSDSSAPVTHAGQSPPQTSPLTADDISRRDRETGPKAFEGMPVDQLMEEFDMVTAQQAALVAQLRARLDALSPRVESCWKAEENVRKLSMEYDERTVPSTCFVAIADAGGSNPGPAPCCHGPLNLRGSSSLWDVELVAGDGGDEILELDYPIDVPILLAKSRDNLNPLSLEKEIRLKDPHIPRSDGVPVSVATVSPKDSELLGKLEEAGDAAYQVGRSEQSRCHSV
ncbi:hypothetical protein Tco_1123521 [Tanacetum coccineum]|uniref:Transposase (putative) gypsy type domain-containing protein n=1 Tax=Tanacetum coccineum TaxID=301880 RepID=A0ABQ5J3K9_9ASTR